MFLSAFMDTSSSRVSMGDRSVIIFSEISYGICSLRRRGELGQGQERRIWIRRSELRYLPQSGGACTLWVHLYLSNLCRRLWMRGEKKFNKVACARSRLALALLYLPCTSKRTNAWSMPFPILQSKPRPETRISLLRGLSTDSAVGCSDEEDSRFREGECEKLEKTTTTWKINAFPHLGLRSSVFFVFVIVLSTLISHLFFALVAHAFEYIYVIYICVFLATNPTGPQNWFHYQLS